MFPAVASISAFLILAAFLYLKSYYPYTFIYKSHSKIVSARGGLNILDPRVKETIGDGMGGTFYIDSVQKDPEDSLVVYGRYYSVKPADFEISVRILRDYVSKRIGIVFAEGVCNFGVDFSKMSVREALAQQNANVDECLKKVEFEVLNNFEVRSFDLKDDGRLKKVFFLSLVVAIFFGVGSYIFLEVLSDLKKN